MRQRYRPVEIALVIHLVAMLCLVTSFCCGQSVDSALNLPSGLLGKLQARTARLNDQLAQQTNAYLQKMQRHEARMRRKLYAVDSNAAKRLFDTSPGQYAALQQKILTDTGNSKTMLSGAYLPYADSLQGALKFLQRGSPGNSTLQGAASQFQALQAKMGDADMIKSYIQQRKQMIGDYISQHANLQGLFGKDYAGMNQTVYYYSQQLREYKEMWNHPDQLEQKTLALLNRVPAFQTFMKSHSQLAGLFGLPANYGTPAGLAGLQTKEVVAQQIQSQVAAGGPNGAAALQANMQSAESQLDDCKNKISQLGQGNGDIDMPNFRPNDQKTKTFWKRLEYGANFQTTRNSYYFPTVTDFGLSLGYKLGHSNIVGVGASYKVGWGNGIQHVALSSQGVGLRSFLEIKIKGSFSATGGLEYNYATPFSSFQDIRQIERWTQSGLIGISKTVSVKSRVFKKTKLQLLWDFLSYQQVPKTQPVLFRIGYAF